MINNRVEDLLAHYKSESDELHRNFAGQLELPNSLYHYTDDKGLEGILKNKELWLTSHKFLNDPMEIKFM